MSLIQTFSRSKKYTGLEINVTTINNPREIKQGRKREERNSMEVKYERTTLVYLPGTEG